MTEENKEEKYNSILEQVEKMSALELSELVKAIENKFGVSAAMPLAPLGGGTGSSPAAEEKTAFDVLLKEIGQQKIQVIKAVKEITGLGLQESKNLVDGAPKVVKTGLKKEEAEEIKKKLEAAGAVAELQ